MTMAGYVGIIAAGIVVVEVAILNVTVLGTNITDQISRLISRLFPSMSSIKSVNIHNIFMKYPSDVYEPNVYHVYIVMQSGSIYPIPLT